MWSRETAKLTVDGDSPKRFKGDFKALRLSHGWKGRALSVAAGYSHNQVYKVENEDLPIPRPEAVALLLKTAGVDPDTVADMVRRCERLRGLNTEELVATATPEAIAPVGVEDTAPTKVREEPQTPTPTEIAPAEVEGPTPPVAARIKTKWAETDLTGFDSPPTPPIGVAALRRLLGRLLTSPAAGAAVLILVGLAIAPFVRDTTGPSVTDSPTTSPPSANAPSTSSPTVPQASNAGVQPPEHSPVQGELRDYVKIPTTYSGMPQDLRHYDVRGVTGFHGRTMLDQHEQLWLLLAAPQNPSVSNTADPRGPFVVGTSDRIRPNGRGVWDGIKIDIGRGKCDEGATFYVLQVVSRPSSLGARRSVIDSLRHRGETYPKLPRIPHDSKAVGGVELTMQRYNGGHTLCPER